MKNVNFAVSTFVSAIDYRADHKIVKVYVVRQGEKSSDFIFLPLNKPVIVQTNEQ